MTAHRARLTDGDGRIVVLGCGIVSAAVQQVLLARGVDARRMTIVDAHEAQRMRPEPAVYRGAQWRRVRLTPDNLTAELDELTSKGGDVDDPPGVPDDRTICGPRPGMETLVRSYVPPTGAMLGHLIDHGEILSIGRALSVRAADGALDYAPTVCYAYWPCDAAVASIHALRAAGYDRPPRRRVMTRDIVSGADYLGVLLLGDHGGLWHGSCLDIHETRGLVGAVHNATTLQVAGSVGRRRRLGARQPRPRAVHARRHRRLERGARRHVTVARTDAVRAGAVDAERRSMVADDVDDT